ncbi:MAG: zinc ribbon domain-containing protein [Nitrospirota bacterium]
MICSKCGFEIPDITSICPNCGQMRNLSLDLGDLESTKMTRRTAMDNLALLALLFSLILGIITGIISGSPWVGIITFLFLHGFFIYNHMNIRTKLKLDKKSSLFPKE